MRPIVLLAALMLPVLPAGAQQRLAKPDGTPCAPSAQQVIVSPGEVKARKLNEMPPAAQFLTVYRTVDRCPEPVVLRRGIGTPAK